jgi:hypothetical protein
MIIVHDTFICKPGNASKLAKLFKEQNVRKKRSGKHYDRHDRPIQQSNNGEQV